MSSVPAYEEPKTALLGGKDPISYNALLQQRNLSAEDITNLPKTAVRRKVRDDQAIKLTNTGRQTEKNDKEANTVLLYEDILPNDTIQSFSLRYGCSVNDIKRANGLIAEQDFYALKRLKIPVNRYSLLTVKEEKQRHREICCQLYSDSAKNFVSRNPDLEIRGTFETSLPTNALRAKPNSRLSSEFDSTESFEETDSFLPLSLVSENSLAADASAASKYLKKLDKDIHKTVKKAEIKNDHSHHNESLNEVLSSIQYYSVETMPPPPNRDRGTNGADCGMKWWAVVLCFFIILAIIIALAIFESYPSK